MDAAAPALLVAQAIGRVGNWFNQELFGRRPTCRGDSRSTRRTARRSYAAHATFHPTFLYEIIWNLCARRRARPARAPARVRPPGLFASMSPATRAFRIFEELLRVDPAHHILGLRLNLFVACALTVAGLTWFAQTQRPRGGTVVSI